MTENDVTVIHGAYREALTAAWLAGFMASAEGWNGEYPFDKDISVGRPGDAERLLKLCATWVDDFAPSPDSEAQRWTKHDPEFYGCTPEECATTPGRHCCIPWDDDLIHGG